MEYVKVNNYCTALLSLKIAKKLSKSDQIQTQLNLAINEFQSHNPSASVDELIELYRLMNEYPYVSHWINLKKENNI